jgi:hypothetical protein
MCFNVSMLIVAAVDFVVWAKIHFAVGRYSDNPYRHFYYEGIEVN